MLLYDLIVSITDMIKDTFTFYYRNIIHEIERIWNLSVSSEFDFWLLMIEHYVSIEINTFLSS